MPKRADAPTGYTSPVRDKAKEATRERIIDALVRVVLDEGVHAFSVQAVAKRAGVSHRTVYRHFASREELLEGLSEAIESSGSPEAAEARREKPMLDAAREDVRGFFEALEADRDRTRAEFIIGVALAHNTQGKRHRWAQVQKEVRATFPALTSDEQLAAAATLRALLSSNVWFHLCVQLGVPADAAARGVSRAIELVLDDLAKRNAAPIRSKTRSGTKRKRAKQ